MIVSHLLILHKKKVICLKPEMWQKVATFKGAEYFRKALYLQSECQLHTPSKLETSVALCCKTKLHISEWPFIVPSTR